MSTLRQMLLVLLSVGIVCGLAQGTAFADVVSYWQFNNDLTDSSGNGHTGHATSTPHWRELCHRRKYNRSVWSEWDQRCNNSR